MGSFRMNPAFPEQAKKMPGVQAVVAAKAEEVRGATEADIPMPGGRAKPVTVSDIPDGKRVTVEGSFGHINEWGSANSAPRGSLRKACEAAGLNMDKTTF